VNGRTVSGVRNAEMKWTNHDNLSTYGVRMVGWPADIPMQNPSKLSTSQNQILKQSLENGTLRICRLDDAENSASSSTVQQASFQTQMDVDLYDNDERADISWAFNEDENDMVYPRLGFRLDGF